MIRSLFALANVHKFKEPLTLIEALGYERSACFLSHPPVSDACCAHVSEIGKCAYDDVYVLAVET